MTNALNQTQIEPSAKAIESLLHVRDLGFERRSPNEKVVMRFRVHDELKAAYAIDLAPIVAERDKLNKMYSDLELHFDAIVARADRRAVERDRMKAALERIKDSQNGYIFGLKFERVALVQQVACAALEPKQ